MGSEAVSGGVWILRDIWRCKGEINNGCNHPTRQYVSLQKSKDFQNEVIDIFRVQENVKGRRAEDSAHISRFIKRYSNSY